MAYIAAALGEASAFISAHPVGILGACALFGLVVMMSAGRKG